MVIFVIADIIQYHQLNSKPTPGRNEILTRVVCLVKFLSSMGLPFRGGNQLFVSKLNELFLLCLELISDFDPFLPQHIVTNVNESKGSVS